jgi:hypothetical protein
MKIDWKKLKTAIAEDTKDIRAKKLAGWRGGALNHEKLIATRHHAIAAHLRGHIHLTGKFLCNPRLMGLSDMYIPCVERGGMSLEEQAKFIAKELPDFELKEAPMEISAQTA